MKIRLIAVLCLVALLLCACASDTPSVEPAQKKNPTIKVTIAGNDLSSYRVIYAKTPYEESEYILYDTEYDFYRLCAERIAASLAEHTGITLPVLQDTETEVGEHEILVGPTNREKADRYASLDVYISVASVENNNLYLGGGHDATSYTDGFKRIDCFAASYHAWDLIEDRIDSAINDHNESFDLAEGYRAEQDNDFYTVVCIGDSITEGAGSALFIENNAQLAYPAALGRLLWQDYLVFNFGRGSRFMRTDLPWPYIRCEQYTSLMNHAIGRADLALVMLGTNDANGDDDWSEADEQLYLSCAQELIGSMTQANPKLSVAILNNPAYYQYPSSTMPIVRSLQNDLVGILSDSGTDTYFFDMNAQTSEKAGPYRYWDGLHPLSEGYLIMAQGLAPVVEGIRAGTYTFTLPEYTGFIRHDWEQMYPEFSPAEGSVSLLGELFAEKYPQADYTEYNTLRLPYTLTDHSLLEGCHITDIRVPVAKVAKYATFTVGVRYADSNVYLEKKVLRAQYSAGPGWVDFHNVDLDIPEGCILTFGQSDDTLIAQTALVQDSVYNYTSLKSSKPSSLSLPCEIYGTRNGK